MTLNVGQEMLLYVMQLIILIQYVIVLKTLALA